MATDHSQALLDPEAGDSPAAAMAATSFGQILRRQARLRPAAMAFAELDGSLGLSGEISYRDLEARAKALAAGLQARTVPGDRCLLSYPPGIDFAVAFFGCQLAGLIAVPVLPFSGARRDARIEAVAADAAATVGLTSRRLAGPAGGGAGTGAAGIDWLRADDLAGRMAPEDWRAPAADPDDLALLQYTSGSTERPRGVRVTQRNLLRNAEMIAGAMGVDEDTVGLSWLPVHHDMGLIGCVLQPVYSGRPLYQMSPQHFAKRPLDWLRAISLYRATLSGGADFAYRWCAEAARAGIAADLDLSGWAVAFSGAEAVRAETLEQFCRAFASSGFRSSAIMPCYGLAEATLWVAGGAAGCGYRSDRVRRADLEQGRAVDADGEAEAAEDAVALVGCGHSPLESDLRIVDPESGRECAAGAMGEIWYAGSNVADGYWRVPEATAEWFGASLPGVEGVRFLRTGDLGLMRDGELFVTGRLKDVIIQNGRNHYPDDLEAIVRAAHPRLARSLCAAFSIEDGGREQVAVVVEAPARRLAEAEAHEIKTAVHAALWRRGGVAARIVLAVIGQIPRTSSGKVRRGECRSRLAQGAIRPVHAGATRKIAPVAAEAVDGSRIPDGFEHWLLDVAGAALNAAAGDLEPETPLSSLGLDSLAAMRIAAALEQALAVEVPLELLFEDITVRGLARWAAAQNAAALPPRPRPDGGAAFDPFPLRPVQEAYLVGRDTDLALGDVATQLYMEFEGYLDRGRLTDAWNAIVRRHDMLRAVVTASGEQHILPDVPLYAIEEVDLSDLSQDTRDKALADRREAMSARMSPLGQWPFFELRLSRLPSGVCRLHLVVDMLIADLASIMLVLAELNRRLRDADFRAPALSFTFRDYVIAEQAMVRSEAGDQARQYWLDRLADLPLPPQLPMLQPPAGGLRFARRRSRLSPEQWRGFRARAGGFGLTDAAALCAAYAEVLTRWSDSAHFLLALPLGDRLPFHPQVDELVGDFTRIELLEIDNRARAPFAGRARAHQARLQADLKARLYDGVEVLRQLARGGLDGAPGLAVFTCGLGLSNRLQREREDWRVGVLGEGISQTARVLLDHQVIEVDEGLEIQWDAPEGLFPPGLLDDMFGAYVQVLVDLADGDEAWIADSLVGLPARQRRIQDAANDTARRLPAGRLETGFLARAEAEPEAIAVVAADATLTYRALREQAERVREALVAAGVAAGAQIAVVAPPGAAQVAGVIGVLLAGAVYVPFDCALPAARRNALLERSDIVAVAAIPAPDGSDDWPEGLARISLAAGDLQRAPASRPVGGQGGMPGAADDLAYLIFTSGSTGQPKGVALDHAGPVNTIADVLERFAVTAADRVLGLSSLSFDLSVFDIFGPLAAGGALVLPSPDDEGSPSEWFRRMAEHRVTIWNSVPAKMEILVDHLERGGEAPSAAPLRLALLSGDWVPLDLPARIRALWPACRVVSLGGATEASIWSICHEVDRVDPAWTSIPYGRPMANQRFAVLNERGEACPDWVPGELWIGGAGVGQGYWGDPENTAAHFVLQPETGERLYRTGDFGRRRPDGEIEFLGRRDAQVKINGFRIELGDIEAALAHHPLVQRAVAIRLGDRHSGRLAAYVTPVRGRKPAASDLRDFLQTRLPAYMVPGAILVLDAFPLSANGKIDRSRLPAPEAMEQGEVRALVDDALTATVARIVARALGADRVAADANFFDLGATSLHLLRIRRALEDELGRTVALTELFRHTNVTRLARSLQRAAAATPKASAPAALERRADTADDIAIVGMSGHFPGSPTLAEFWRNLQASEDCLVELGEPELDDAGISQEARRRPEHVRRAASLDGVDMFDAGFFGISPREAELMDPQHRLFLECAWEALEDSGHAPGRAAGRVGVYAGSSLSTYLLLTAPDLSPEQPSRFLETLIANDKDYLATRVSYKLDLNGPSVTVQTACSTSLVAVATAAQALRSGDCDLALAGGVTARLPQGGGYRWEKGGVLSADGHCRPFDAAAQGTIFGNGVGVVALKRLGDALRDGDSIDAVIKGWAVNNDGSRKIGFTAPSVEGQVRVLADAHAHAGISADSVSYVEAHGTGTHMGDPVEVLALREAFGDPAAGEEAWCALGSVKGHIGHLDAAAGVAALIKTVLALRHRIIPPIANFRRPSPALSLSGGPFFLADKPRPWTRAEDAGARRAGVSSFGVGGTNCHVVLEEAPACAAPLPALRPEHLFCLSAMSPEALRAQAARLAERLQGGDPLDLGDVAATLARGRRHMPERAAFVASDLEGCCAILNALAHDGNAPGLHRARVSDGASPQVTLLFGERSTEFLEEALALAELHEPGRRILERCDEILRQHGGASLRDGLDSSVDPAAATALEIALVEIWRSLGVHAAAVAPYGSGDHAAAWLAGSVGLEDALALAAEGRDIDWASQPPSLPVIHRDGAPRKGRRRKRAEVEVAMSAAQAAGYEALPLLPAFGGGSAWASVLDAVGRLWTLGLTPDFDALRLGQQRRRVHLPTYPWQRRRYWRQASARALRDTGAAPQARDYPLPWTRVKAATLQDGQHLFETRVGTGVCPFLSDHRVFGAVVVPGALLLELALTAGARVLAADALEVTDFALRESIVLDGGHPVAVQILLEAGGGGFQLRIFSEPRTAAAPWVLHATGRLAVWSDDAAMPVPPVNGREPEGGEPDARDRLYAALAERGVDLGRSFQTVSKLVFHDGEARGTVRGPDDAPDDAGAGFFFDPRLLDGCFQIVAAAFGPEGAPEGVYLPVSIDRLRVRRLDPSARLESKAALRASSRSGPEGVVQADVIVADLAGGAVVAEARGMRFVRTWPQALLSPAAAWADIYRRVWVESGPEAEMAVGRGARHWAVFADEVNLGAQVFRQLEEAGVAVTRVLPGEDHAQVLREIVAGGEALGVVVVHGGDEAEPFGACRAAMMAAQAMAALAPEASPEIVAVTRGAMAVGSEDRPDPFQAALWGFMRALAAEQPDWRCALVDLDPETEDAKPLPGMLLGGIGDRTETAFRGGRRLRPQTLRVPAEAAAAPPPARGVYLISGGSGAVGLEVSRWLFDRGARTLVWLSRSPLPAEAEAARRELESRGARVLALACDVASAQDLAVALSLARDQGEIRGVYHLAAVLEDALIDGLDWTSARRIIDPKALGAANLDRLVTEELDEFVCFSSLAGTLGSRGQSAYAAGNAFLDALGEARRARGQAGLTVAWGPWAGAGMTGRLGEALRRRIERMGVALKPPQTYLRSLDRALTLGLPSAIVADIRWEMLAEAAGGALPAGFDSLVGAAAPARPPAGRALADRLGALPAARRKPELELYLRKELARHLCLASEDEVAPRSRLFDLGLDSLLAIDLKAQLESELGLELPGSILFDYPTAEFLAEFLARKLGWDEAIAPAEDATVKAGLEDISVAYLLSNAAALSDGDIRRLLGEARS